MGKGGGIYNQVKDGGNAIANLEQSTLNLNSGGNIFNQNGIVKLSKSIAANAPGDNFDCETFGGSVFDLGYNLVEDGTCGFPNGGDPILANLNHNGGTTQTHAVQPGSPALDGIPPAQCGSSQDQRGTNRPVGAGCDIGSYELDVADVEFEQNVNQHNVIPGELITFTMMVNPIGPGISNGIITATIPQELEVQWPIILDPPESGIVGVLPTIAHSIVITANHILTVTMAANVQLGLPGGTDFQNLVSFQSNEIYPSKVTTTTIHVNNASPIAIPDDGVLYLTDPNTVFTTGNILDNDSDPNLDPLIILELFTSNLKGSLTPIGVESGKPNGDGSFRYDPDGQFSGMLPGEIRYDTFTYRISDGQGGESEFATVSIAIKQNETYLYLPLLTKSQ
jgi:hypothetical protein